MPCYEAGDFTLAGVPDGLVCVVHAAAMSDPDSDATLQKGDPASGQAPGGAARRRGRAPRGRAARQPAPPGRHGPRARTVRRTIARRVARAMAYGRRRAAARVAGPGYDPHPGWRHLIAEGYRVITEQTEALAWVDALVDVQQWRSDKRAAWSAMLRQLVHAMDWDTGLISAVTAARLGVAGDRAPRTVSRLIAWAREVELLVVVEHAASAEFLGTDHGRTPTYALVTNQPLPAHSPAPAPAPDPNNSTSAQLTTDLDESGDLPVSHVEIKPLNGRRLEQSTPATPDWPLYGVPQSAPDRTAATRRLFQRLGLDRGWVSRVPLWRARALLKPWWDAGACPAGLLHAIDHHPDHPTHHRGDLFRGIRDPLRVLGARLRPWQHRLGELPAEVTGISGDYRPAPRADADELCSPAVVPDSWRPSSNSATRRAARAHLDKTIAARRYRQGNPQ